MLKDIILGKRTNVSRLHFTALEDPAAYETFLQAYLRQFSPRHSDIARVMVTTQYYRRVKCSSEKLSQKSCC